MSYVFKLVPVTFFVATLVATSAVAIAESPLGVGVKGGVPLNDAFEVHSSNPVEYVADTHRYEYGPYVELRLPAGFGIELDGLYRTFEYRAIVGPTSFDRNSHAWQFPLLIKKRFLPGPVKPYIEAGAAFSHLSVSALREVDDRNTWGLVLGGGIDLTLGPIHIMPEIRYTGWTSRGFQSPDSVLRSNRNEAAVLVGIGF